MLRTFSTSLLVGILTICPVLCRTVEVAHASLRGHATEVPTDAARPPCDLAQKGDDCCPADADDRVPPGGDDCCPEGGDNCICGGAVEAHGSQDLGPGTWGDSPCFDALPGVGSTAHTHAFVHLTSDGQPAGLASWGDALSVRARLQNFRC